MIKRLVLLVALSIMSLSTSVFADESADSIIEGQVVNGTSGSSVVADQDITLSIYLDDEEVDTIRTKTDVDGRFAFNGLSSALGYSYEATINYQGAEYRSERLNFSEGETTKSTEVIVYEATNSDETIIVAMSHMIIYLDDNGLLVKEYYLLDNMSDQTYIGATDDTNTRVLRFPLPQGATNLQPTIGLMDCCIVQNEDGFYDTMPILPGNKEVAYSYIINHISRKYTFPKIINYPTYRFDLLVQGEEVKITCDQLATDEPMDINGVQFTHLSGQEFTKSENLEIRLSGLPRTNSQGSMIWVLLALVVITAGFIYVYLLKRKRPQPVSDDGTLNPQQLLAELAELDDEFEGGDITEEAYHKLRAEKKAALVEIMKRQKEE